MKEASHFSQCIACGSKTVKMAAMTFMVERRKYSICDDCAPYVERVSSDQSFIADYMRFLGVTKMEHCHQSGGAFTFAVPRGAAPDDLEAHMNDFGMYREFIGQRIRTLRSHEPAA
jgi:hypothetical protein